MTDKFIFEVFNYKYNIYLPAEIIGKLDDKIVKVRCYVFKDEKNEDGTTTKVLKDTFETCCFWTYIREIR